MNSLQPESVDLTTCDREPIQIPGSIQPHGVLLALDEPTLVVRHASENARSILGLAADPVGQSLHQIFGEEIGSTLRQLVQHNVLPHRAVHLQQLTWKNGSGSSAFDVIAHRNEGLLFLELETNPARPVEAVGPIHPLVEEFINRLEGAATISDLCRLAAEETRHITGFDRVLIYQFDEGWNGFVVAESRNDRMPSYMDLRFPASDIPRQARELYRMNPIRIIPDADYRPVAISPAINAATEKPLDLTHSVLRSVSPVHLEYMKNMGMAASMSISILRDGRLWGLISCHHKTPRLVPFNLRLACDFVAKVFSLQLAAKQHAEDYAYRVRLKSTVSRLLANMSHEDNFVDALVKNSTDFLELTNSSGAAVVFDGDCRLFGQTPSQDQVNELVQWLSTQARQELVVTDSITSIFPQANEFSDTASGLLAIPISQLYNSYILWFRPEIVRTVKWGGDPRKPVAPEPGGQRLHPRKSFEAWKETVREKGAPWQPAEVETATEFRNVILGIVLRKAEELASLSRELERSNKELEAFSYSVSHDLRAPFRHIVGFAELLREQKSREMDEEANRYIETIIESANYAGMLVDNLLAFSQMGRTSLTMGPIDMKRLIAEVRADVMSEAAGREISWHVDDLPVVQGDVVMIRLAVRNLLANAVKYTGQREKAEISVTCEQQLQQIVFKISDNGVGFDMQYVDKLFGVFQRLHRMEEFEGTGIGLANVRRIISRHGGQTWATGVLNQGATFFFSLPKVPAVPAKV
jgi:light-regulated signal transduction histidine kinase (bacteriophytochrome)